VRKVEKYIGQIMKMNIPVIGDRAIALWSKGIRPLKGIAATAPLVATARARNGGISKGDTSTVWRVS